MGTRQASAIGGRLDAATGVLFVVLMTVAVPALLVSAVALFIDRGPFQFGGVIDLGGSVPALLWILSLSFVMMRAEPRTSATP